ncbi:MAG: hypothetical protein JWM80_6229, partial [Cyanobacteria bacterium RYN_339]|nr:hypothetical protein [Cyanobacteria bacterium RYN_339]
AYDPGQATGALMPLAHLSATVKDVPVLNELFPSMVVAPPWEGWRRDLEDLAEAPPPPAPAMMAAAPEVPVAAPDASRQRLSAIVAYINNPKGDPLYADPTVMFRVVADEHLFQQQAGQALRERLKLAPATQWPQIQEELAVATKRQGQMQTLLRRLAAQQRPG